MKYFGNNSIKEFKYRGTEIYEPVVKAIVTFTSENKTLETVMSNMVYNKILAENNWSNTIII